MIKKERMFFFFLLFAAKTAWSIMIDNINVHSNLNCDGEIFNDIYLDKEILFTNLKEPSNLILDESRNMLYFRQKVTETDEKNETYKITMCNIVDNECSDVKDIKGGCTIAYDPQNHDVYMGGLDGIYQYNFSVNTPEYVAEQGKSIRDMFIRKSFYYIQNPNCTLHVYKNGNFTIVEGTENLKMEHFYVSKFRDMYYSNKNGAFKVEYADMSSHRLQEDITTVQITETAFDDVYFASPNGIYLADKDIWYLNLAADIQNVHGLAFDENFHPIIATDSIIFRLSPSAHAKDCYDRKILEKDYQQRKAKEKLLNYR